jgi:hypothetical protein
MNKEKQALHENVMEGGTIRGWYSNPVHRRAIIAELEEKKPYGLTTIQLKEALGYDCVGELHDLWRDGTIRWDWWTYTWKLHSKKYERLNAT